MKKTFSLVAILCAMVLGLSNCKKGDTGPAGTANVMYSEWFTPNTYIKDTIFGVWGFKYNKAAPGITQKVLDTGVVLTFGKMLGYNPAVWPTGQIGQLPITITYMQGGLNNDTWSALASVGNLRIRFVNDKNTYNTIATQHQFRYIIIPGGMPGGRTRPLTYQEVCQRYNIPE